MLNRKIAETIVEEASLRVNRNVNIMNRNGLIIATCDESRLNQIHEGAIKVLQSNQPLYIYPKEGKEYAGVKPGVNLPIVFQEQMIGVIGITGNPDEISEISQLVKMMTELMIHQNHIQSQFEWKQRTHDMVFIQLLKKEFSSKDITRLTSGLDFEWTPEFRTLIVQLKDRSTSNQTLVERLENTIGQNKGFIGFINVNRLCIILTDTARTDIEKKIDAVYNVLTNLNLTFRLSYSLPFNKLEDFRASFLDCDLALSISDPQRDIISFENIEARALIYRLDQQTSERFAKRILKNLDEVNVKTLTTFFDHNLNIQKAADHLYVHRNTLIYRLNKIAERTGLDPRKFDHALSLQLALWIDQ